MQVKWREGAYVSDGLHVHKCASKRIRGMITNFHAQRPLRFINIGQIVESSSTRVIESGRREVYIAALGRDEGIDVHVVRMQDWDMWHDLDRGENVDFASFHADEYQNYTLNCRNLAMRLGATCEEMTPFVVKERYDGSNKAHTGKEIDAHYVVRPYIHGTATDKIAADHWKDPAFVEAAARLLGKHTAANMIIGRGRKRNGGIEVYFNDGDEYFTLKDGVPVDVKLGDPSGCFRDVERSFSEMRCDYESRLSHLFDAGAQYRSLFVDALVQEYTRIRDAYLHDPESYNHFPITATGNPERPHIDERPQGAGWHFRDRMKQASEALKRLESTTPQQMADAWR
ncbi:MAG: hypothetical protein AABY13_05870, partial [Nanoarchaeota archaeon]